MSGKRPRRAPPPIAPPITWRTPLRAAIRFGLPFAGAATILYWVVASIGGYISHIGFACGVLLILSGFSARLVEGR